MEVMSSPRKVNPSTHNELQRTVGWEQMGSVKGEDWYNDDKWILVTSPLTKVPYFKIGVFYTQQFWREPFGIYELSAGGCFDLALAPKQFNLSAGEALLRFLPGFRLPQPESFFCPGFVPAQETLPRSFRGIVGFGYTKPEKSYIITSLFFVVLAAEVLAAGAVRLSESVMLSQLARQGLCYFGIKVDRSLEPLYPDFNFLCHILPP